MPSLFPSVDPSTGQLPLSVREAIAANLADGSTVEGSALSAAIATGQRIVRGNGFVALGDSISTAADMGNGGAGYGAAWPHMACALSGQRLAFMGNGGVAGQTSTQILARVPDVIALGAQVVTVLAGTNDLTQSVTFAVWSANIRAIVAQLRAANIRVVLCTIPPRSTTTYLTSTLAWNSWLKSYAQQNNLDLLDFFDVLTDPLTGTYKAGFAFTDGLHPEQTAHIALATYVVAQLQTSAYTPIAAQIGVGDTGNMIANPLLSGAGVPSSWFTSGSAGSDFVEGVVTDPDFRGQAWKVAYTATAAANVFREFKSAPILSGFSAGDTILVSLRAKITASNVAVPGPTPGLIVRIQRLNAGTVYWTPVGADATVHGAALLQFKMVVPSGTTSLLIDTIVGNMPAGSTFTSLVGEFALVNLTTGNLLTA